MSIKIFNQEEKKQLRDITKEARKISCAEIADNVYGLTLYRSKNSNRYLKCYEHPSLSFDLQKNLVFYNAKTIHGMGPYDFMAFYENTSLMDAREKLNEYYLERDPRHLQLYHYNRTNDEVYIHHGMMLPRKHEGMQDEIRNYLLQFNISEEVINNMIMNSAIYQAENSNLVVVGTDEKETPAFAVIYGTNPEKPFKIESQGSFTKMGFFVKNPESDRLVICDSVINALAFLTVDPKANVLASIDQEHLLETVEYNFNSSERTDRNYSSVYFAIGNEQAKKDLIQKIMQNKNANAHYVELIKKSEELSTDNTIRSYIRHTSGISTIDTHYDVQYKDMKDLLAISVKANEALEQVMANAKEIEDMPSI